jgi:hypothetical protein
MQLGETGPSRRRDLSTLGLILSAIVPVLLVAISAYPYFLQERPEGLDLIDLDMVITGDLVDLSDPKVVAPSNLLIPTYAPGPLILAGVIRPHNLKGTFYLVYDTEPMRAGEFRLRAHIEAGGIVLVEAPSHLHSPSQQEAYVAYVIGEVGVSVERVEPNGHVGAIGHGVLPQIRWWQGGWQLSIIGHLSNDEFIRMAESVQPIA